MNDHRTNEENLSTNLSTDVVPTSRSEPYKERNGYAAGQPELGREERPRPLDEKEQASSSEGDTVEPLLSTDEGRGLRARWESLQVGFVDEPRRSVEQADQLVVEAIKRLTEGFSSQRRSLEHQWDRGEAVSTEDLRLALRRYRSFFERLLAA